MKIQKFLITFSLKFPLLNLY